MTGPILNQVPGKNSVKKLREGDLDDKEIDIEVSSSPVGVEIMAPPGMEEMTNQLQGMFQNLTSGRTKTRKLRIKGRLAGFNRRTSQPND